MDVSKFWDEVCANAFSEERVDSIEGKMHVIWIVACGPFSRIGEVDFDSFNLSDAKHALDEMMYYESDETIDFDEVEEYGAPNKEHLLTELNRTAHFSQIAGLEMRKAKKKKIKFV